MGVAPGLSPGRWGGCRTPGCHPSKIKHETWTSGDVDTLRHVKIVVSLIYLSGIEFVDLLFVCFCVCAAFSCIDTIVAIQSDCCNIGQSEKAKKWSVTSGLVVK